MTYRKLRPEESGLYRSIRLESLQLYPDSFCSTYEQQLEKEKLGFENYIEIEHPDKFIMGAFKEDELIGICGFHRSADDWHQHRGEIIQVYIRAGHQGQNISMHLISACMEIAFKLPGLERIELGVLSSSKAAHRIYEKLGFEEYGVQKNYLKKGELYQDQIFMVKTG